MRGGRHRSADLAHVGSPEFRGLLGRARRMAVRFTERLWQLTGHKIEGVRETIESEPFSGVGFYARPPAGSKTAEAVVISIGESAQHHVIIATRDEAIRQVWTDELDAGADVAAMFTSTTIVLIKPDGTVEIRSKDGTAVPLAKASELQALAAAFYGHGHPGTGAPPTTSYNPLEDPVPDDLTNPGQPGTTVLKAE